MQSDENNPPFGKIWLQDLTVSYSPRAPFLKIIYKPQIKVIKK